MITVLFFAQVRELVGTDRLELEAEYPTVEALRHALTQKVTAGH
ncbi:Sulfur carrier protein moaD [Providencia rustigianii]|nr:Sulfur carrier protein moaD [Providencia rustigianii]